MTDYSSSKQDFLVPVSAPVSSKQGFKTTDLLQLKQTDIFLNRQWIVHSQDMRVGWHWRSGHDPAWLPFLTWVFSSWLCPVQNANGHTLKANQGKGHVWAHAKWGCHIFIYMRVLIGNCKLHNNRLYCACLSHNSVCYHQMSVCIEYLWTLNRLLVA